MQKNKIEADTRSLLADKEMILSGDKRFTMVCKRVGALWSSYKNFLSRCSMPQNAIMLDLSDTDGLIACKLEGLFPHSLVIACCETEKTFRRTVKNIILNDSGHVIAVRLDQLELIIDGIINAGLAITKAVNKEPDIIESKYKALMSSLPFFVSVKQAYVMSDFAEKAFSAFSVSAIFGSRIYFSAQDTEMVQSPVSNFIKKIISTYPNAALCTEEYKPIPANRLFLGNSTERDVQVSVQGSTWVYRKDRFATNKSRLDIVVPMFNVKEYIEPCIESLIEAQRNDIDVIIVDDGSTDGSLRLVQRKYGNHPRVKIVSKPNGGCASARNYGRMVSQTSHITFVDSDDFVDAEMFPYLFDVSLYSGYEVVQAGYDFYFRSQDPKYIGSNEAGRFSHYERIPFMDREVFKVPTEKIIMDQATVWRRVYRRDYLDNKKIYFPDHIMAFDDYLFHVLTLIYTHDILMVDGVKYHYRQHPNQDIKQGDERHFYPIEQMLMLLKRSVEEGWNTFHHILPGFINLINWSTALLREDLIETYLNASAWLWVLIEKCHGKQIFYGKTIQEVNHPDFAVFYARHHERVDQFGDSYHWAFLSGINMQPETLKIARAISGG